MAQVIAVRKLVDVMLQILRGNPMVSPSDASLQLAPKTFKGVCMSNATDVHSASMFNFSVPIAMPTERLINGIFVRMQNGSRDNVFLNNRHERCAFDVGNYHDFDIFLPFNHAEDNSFPRRTAPLFNTFALAPIFSPSSHISFVEFHMVSKRLFEARIKEQANLFRNAPGGFVSNFKRSLKLFSGHAIIAFCECKLSKRDEALQKVKQAIEKVLATGKCEDGEGIWLGHSGQIELAEALAKIGEVLK